MRLFSKINIIFSFLFLFHFASAQQNEKDIRLLQAAFDGDVSALIQALKDTADINTTTEQGVSPLIYAAQQGHVDLVKILVYNKANIYHKSNDSVNVLLAASIFNHVEIVDFVAGKGLSVNTFDNRGITPMHYAAAYGYTSMFSKLYELGADLNCRDQDGNTPLITAVYVGNTFMVDSLITHGADINAKDDLGFTPLMIAVMQSYSDITYLLLQKGADANLITNSGTSALSLAVDFSNYPGIDSLLAKGAIIRKEKDKAYVNPVLLAYQDEQYPVLKHLKKKGIKLPAIPIIKNSFFALNADLNQNDFMIGPSLGLFDRRYRIDAAIGFNTRIASKRVLVKDINGDELQYYEGRQSFYISLKKHFSFTKNISYPALLIGIEEHYTWGSYKATTEKAKKGFYTVPSVAVQWKSNPYSSVSVGVKYFNYDEVNVFPVRVFASYNFYFDLINATLDNNPRNAKKSIKWLY